MSKIEPGEPVVKTGEPTVVEPKPEPAPGPSGEPTPEPKPEPKPEPTDPMSVTFEGEGVPEKLRGKTVKEVLAMQAEAEKALGTANLELGQWRQDFHARQQAGQQPGKEKYDPFAHLDEETAKAVLTLHQMQLAPLTQGLSSVMFELVKGTRPDFDQVEKRVKEIYNQMDDYHKFDPRYGWDWAYKMAKTEVMPPAAAPLPQPGPTTTPPMTPKAPELTPEQRKMAAAQGLTTEEYIKYLTPGGKSE